MASTSREEIIESLRRSGYEVDDINGVLTFHLSEDDYLSNKIHKQLRKLLEQLGYYQSFGMRPDKDKKSE